MEGLIEFIFGNLFFVILIAGALWNLFMRNKANEEEQKRQQQKRQQQRRTGGSPQQEVDWKEIFKQERKPVEKAPPAPAQPTAYQLEVEQPVSVSNEYEKQRVEVKRKEREVSKKLEILEQSPILAKEIGKRGPSLHLDFNNMTGNDVVKGVVWSEVLGKPRAKRSLTSMSKYHR